ncbi:COP9 signalosome complex subunit 4 [Scedosporium apiospermum]|uniref:COP9 signalosome complex subunit 4 n=1 Tax=Pseudallescheria apiosperma TaxID=563466 RepID=A0A084GAY6_PSEDA|nr:COP9 signalosome complex subunit 4 [Scedosporium apiospermum]KEZ44498.1 COP9 signalosome complex subunit 4 [Scedosporium apiospermum]
MAPSPKVASALAQVQSAPDASKPEQYEAILRQIKDLSSPSTATTDLSAIVTSIISASLGIVATRSLLDLFVTTLRDLKNVDLCIEVGNHALELIASTGASSSFLDQIAALRDLIASAHESNEDYIDAARCLAQIPLDSSQRQVTNEQVARIWVRIVRNFLEVDDTPAADTYVNKLKNIMHTVADPELHLHFQLSQARIRDAKRDFLDASKRYHDISFSKAIAEEERLHTLSMAIKCAVLAPAGPQRSRLLARLYRDERSAGLEEFGILEKMFLDRLLRQDEVDKFAKSLLPHQLAVTASGSTVLAKAVVEHNLLGASRLYENIGFDALGALLGLDAAGAEDTTARMIEQGRLLGRIDQVDRVIWFEKGEASGVKGSGKADVLVGKETRRWDANVQGIAEEVEHVVNALQTEYPEFVAAHLRA